MIVYLVSNGEYTKIGISGNFPVRIVNLQAGSPTKLTPVGLFETDDAQRIELMLHGLYASHRALGEWFSLNDAEIEAIHVLMDMLGASEVPDVNYFRPPKPVPVKVVDRPINLMITHDSFTCPVCGVVSAMDRKDRTTCGSNACKKVLYRRRKTGMYLNVVSIEA